MDVCRFCGQGGGELIRERLGAEYLGPQGRRSVWKTTHRHEACLATFEARNEELRQESDRELIEELVAEGRQLGPRMLARAAELGITEAVA